MPTYEVHYTVVRICHCKETFTADSEAEAKTMIEDDFTEYEEFITVEHCTVEDIHVYDKKDQT